MNAANRTATTAAQRSVHATLTGHRHRSITATIFVVFIMASTAVGLISLAVLLFRVLQDGLP
ncbi:MAG: hypothetical protein ACR2J9_07295 [Gaiellales bacterium]